MTLLGQIIQPNYQESERKNATNPEHSQFRSNHRRDGTPVGCVLQECVRAVVCGVAQLPHTGEQGGHGTATENILQTSAKRQICQL